jgi:hypothetical protein
MIKKIISGGQLGADRAALDAAIKCQIPHCGYIPKGRLGEDEPPSSQYQLQEMPTDSDAACAEQSVVDSDGTLIFARGKLTAASDYMRAMTLKHKKQLLGLDLNQISHHDAAALVVSWVQLYKIQTLNVAGPKATEVPGIYRDVYRIIEDAIQLLMLEDKKSGIQARQSEKEKVFQPPRTVQAAVDRLINALSFKDKTTIANMAEVELGMLDTTLGEYIRNEFNLWTDNHPLFGSCCLIAQKENLSEDEASFLIIRELWKKLRQSHKLRIVK